MKTMYLILAVFLCTAMFTSANAADAYYIRSAVGPKYLEVQPGNSSAGTPLQLGDFNGGDAQVWELLDANGHHFLRSKLGRFLDVQRSGSINGTPVHIGDFNGGRAQKWTLIPASDGYYYIQSAIGLFLDVQWGSDRAGTPVWTWSFNGGAAQKWRFEQVRRSGVGVVVGQLSGNSQSRWPAQGAITPIQVCWEDLTASTLADRQQVQAAVTRTWQSASGVRFNFSPGACPNGFFNGIRIGVADMQAHTKGYGRFLAGVRNGMVLNFRFRRWCPSCDLFRNTAIQTIAIHEFGHALGFSHEHNRRDCVFPCEDAACMRPCSNGNCQAICIREPGEPYPGDWNITDCDAQSIMNYCFNSGANNRLSSLDIEGVRAVYGSGPTEPGTIETRTFRPQPIGILCPVGVTRGDGEFGGGPVLWASVRLEISSDGKDLVANIRFIATEMGGDSSTTEGSWKRVIWSAEPNKRIVSITSPSVSDVGFRGPGAGGEFIGCNDGQVITKTPETPGPVRLFHIIGDTGAADISGDDNCSCDTQIRGIEFNSISISLQQR